MSAEFSVWKAQSCLLLVQRLFYDPEGMQLANSLLKPVRSVRPPLGYISQTGRVNFYGVCIMCTSACKHGSIRLAAGLTGGVSMAMV